MIPGTRTAVALVVSVIVAAAGQARAVQCDGSEVLCLNLTSQAETTGAGGTVVSGDFNADGFQPADQGGIDFSFGPGTDFSWGKVEFDIKGLQPTTLAELAGGKVSMFSFCGEPPQEMEYIGCQKMPHDYRDGNIFRYGMDDDNLADNWDAVIITGAGFGCYYSINDPAWLPDETHHIIAEWGTSGMTLTIDGWQCTKPGNGDTFDPAEKLFVIGNRCEHYPNQHPVARISNLQLWALSHDPNCTADNMIEAVSMMPSQASGTGDVFQAVYRHCLGAAEFRVVQLMVSGTVSATAPAVSVGYENGTLSMDGSTCTPGEVNVLSNTCGSLDCERTTVTETADDIEVHWALSFEPATFSGTHFLYVDAKGGPGNPEPRLGWTEMGTYTVDQPEADASVPTDSALVSPDGGTGQADASVAGDGGSVDAADDTESGGVSGGCSCKTHGKRPSAFLWILGLIALLWIARRRSGFFRAD